MKKCIMELNKKYCDLCLKEIKDNKNMCYYHKRDGVRIYRHKQCKKGNNEICDSK